MKVLAVSIVLVVLLVVVADARRGKGGRGGERQRQGGKGHGGEREGRRQQRKQEKLNETAVACSLPMAAGTCESSEESWYYNNATGTCESFTYTGCEGNDNRFRSKPKCMKRCARHAQGRDGGDKEMKGKKGEQMKKGGGRKAKGKGAGKGSAKRERMERKKAARKERKNKNFDRASCLEEPQTGECRSHRRVTRAYKEMWFYNSTSEACETFVYGGCRGNNNRFRSQEICTERCISSAEAETNPSE